MEPEKNLMVYQCQWLPLAYQYTQSQKTDNPGDFSTGISGDPRSTVDSWFCCVAISTGISCTDRSSEQQQCVTSRGFVTMWYLRGESAPVPQSTCAEVTGSPTSCSAMRITQWDKWLSSCWTFDLNRNTLWHLLSVETIFYLRERMAK